MNEKEVKKLWIRFVDQKSHEDKNELIEHYLPLVKGAACKLAAVLPKHLDVNDLIASGVTGLISSVEKFNPFSGHTFKSFSSFRIQGAMLDELRQLDWVPRSVREKSKKMQTAYNEVQYRVGRFASDHEVAEYLGLSEEEFDAWVIETKIVTVISLNAHFTNSKNEDTYQYTDFIKNPSTSIPHQVISKQEQKEILAQAIKALGKQEAIVLTLYYYEDLTFREIGEVLKVTESRISQIHSKAIYKLRGRLNMSEVADHASR